MAFKGSKILERLIAFRKEKPETRHVTKQELKIRYARAHNLSIRETNRREDFQEIYKLWKSPIPDTIAERNQRRSAWFREAIDLGYFEKVGDKWTYVG